MSCNPIPGQANVRSRTVDARADGTPIIAGTVNYYLHALTGANANKWFRTSDNSWQAAEAIAGVMSHIGDGDWKVSVDAEAWPTAGVEYTEYAKESGDLHVPTSTMIRCEVSPTTLHAATDAEIGNLPTVTEIWAGLDGTQLAKFLTEDTGETTAVAGSVGKIAQGSAGGGGPLVE